MWVSPFRHPRIIRYLPFPVAFRSLSRLSSALSAKASALCPFCLTLFLGIALPGSAFFSCAFRRSSLLFLRLMSFLFLCMDFSKYTFCQSFPHWLVETERFELLTPCLQGRCSPN